MRFLEIHNPRSWRIFPSKDRGPDILVGKVFFEKPGMLENERFCRGEENDFVVLVLRKPLDRYQQGDYGLA